MKLKFRNFAILLNTIGEYTTGITLVLITDLLSSPSCLTHEEVDDNMFWSQAADVVASNRWECAPSPEHPSTPSPDPFGESDADAFIDQLLSDGICLTTPAKHTNCELKAWPRSSIGSATSSVSVVQTSSNPVRESQHGTGLAADCDAVLEVAHGTNVKVTRSDSKGSWGGRRREAVDESHEQLPNIGEQSNTWDLF